MQRQDKSMGRKPRPLRSSRTVCRFCKEKVAEVDYKDLPALERMVTRQGKHLSTRRSGNCARHQRQARLALKRARFMALMPFCA